MYKFTDSTNRIVMDGNGWSGFVTAPEVQAWIDAGNTPEPADVPNPKIAIKEQIDTLEAQQLLPRITREFMLSAAEAQAKAAGVDPMTNVGYAKLKEFDTQIAGLRGQL
jgi:hypothetical protein